MKMGNNKQYNYIAEGGLGSSSYQPSNSGSSYPAQAQAISHPTQASAISHPTQSLAISCPAQASISGHQTPQLFSCSLVQVFFKLASAISADKCRNHTSGSHQPALASASRYQPPDSIGFNSQLGHFFRPAIISTYGLQLYNSIYRYRKSMD